MTVKQVGFRLRPEGGADVVAAFKSAEEAGVRAGSATAAAADRATAAASRQEAAWRRNAEAYRAAANAADAQARFNAALGVGRPGSDAAASADVFAAAFRAEEDAARKATALRAQLDPAGAALDRLNGELREYDLLAKRGAISSTELAKAQQLARTRYDEATAALARNTGGLTRNQLASRLNLTRQGADVLVTAGMGMSPGMIALQQGPQILDALATSGLKARGAMLLLGGAIGLAGGAAITGGAAWKNGESQALLLDRAVTGLGRTSGVTAAELEALAISAAEQGEVSVRSARAQAAAYVSTGKIGEEVIGGLIAIGKDYAAMFGQDAEEATQSLARAMAEPDKAARELTRQIGLLDQKTLDHIDTLVKQGDRLAAQKILLEALTGAVEGQADKIGRIESAWDAAARAVSNYWDKLGQALYTTPDERRERLRQGIENAPDTPTGRANRARWERQLRTMDYMDWANGLFGPSAEEAAANQAAQEEKDRKDRTRGGRSGAGAAERAARERLQRERAEEDRAHQLELEIARAAQDTDRIRVLEEEAAIRTRIRQLVDDGASAEDARFKAMSEQARLNEAAAAATEREVGKLFEANVLEIDRLLGLERYVAEQERSEALQARITAYQETGLNLAEATRKATADQLNLDEARAEVLRREVDLAAEAHALTLARLAGDERRTRELEIQARITDRARSIERREGLNFGDGEIRAALEIGDEIAAEAAGGFRKGVRGLLDDLQDGRLEGVLEGIFDRVTDRMKDSLADFLTNLAFDGWGGGKKGGGGPGGLLGGALDFLFGGGVGRNAAGTDWWRGGLTWVGEEGPELAWLPRGSKVASHPQSMRMMAQAAGGGGPTVVNHYYQLDGATIGSDELWRRVERGDRVAAAAGARNGAQTAVAVVHGTATEVQRGEHMLKN